MAKVPLAVILVVLAASASLPAAQPGTTVGQEFVDAHNQARAQVGVEPLTWSDKLANASSLTARYQRDKMACNFARLNGSKYGGNQLWASGAAVTPREAVAAWVAEGKYYDHANNTCAPGHSKCGVYTQVVWRKSVELGCAQVGCAEGSVFLTICFYDPPGNVVGESPY